jgi:uncharacterized membrane protein YozB (DUF420 family)
VSLNTTPYRQDQGFFLNISIGVFALSLVAFAQWALRGYVNYAATPLTVHLHAIAMVSWLVLFIWQNHLAMHGNLTQHRKWGRIGVCLAVLLVGIGVYITLQALVIHRVPPIFTNAYFLVLGPVHLVFFAAVLAVAIARKSQPEWHRRLMLVATVLLMEPAFGRLVPPPLLATPWNPVSEAVMQCALLGIVMLHDRRVRGRVHPALWWGVGCIIASRMVIAGLAASPAVIAAADHLANAG